MVTSTPQDDLTPNNQTGPGETGVAPKAPAKGKRKLVVIKSPLVSPVARPDSSRGPLLKRRLIKAFEQERVHLHQRHHEPETDLEDEDEDDEVFESDNKLAVVLSSSEEDDDIVCGQKPSLMPAAAAAATAAALAASRVKQVASTSALQPTASTSYVPDSPPTPPRQWQEIPSAYELEHEMASAPPPPKIEVVNMAESLTIVPKPQHGFRLGGAEGNNFLYLTRYRGELIAYIQEFREEDGHLIPTMNGVRKVKLVASQMAALEHFLPLFRAIMYCGGPSDPETINHHLGNKVFGSINYSYREVLDIRDNFKPADSLHPIPTKRGVRLSLTAVDQLAYMVDHLKAIWPEYAAISEPCFLVHAREQGQKNLMDCNMCCPDGSEW